jgi:hypothetical protein
MKAPRIVVPGTNVIEHGAFEFGGAVKGAAPNALIGDFAKNRSIRFSHEALVGVKCRCYRGRASSHLRTA